MDIRVRCRRTESASFEQSTPPLWWIERPVTAVCRRVDVVEEVPHCDNIVSLVSIQYLCFSLRVLSYSPCPTAIPHSSSLGQCPCNTTLNAINTHGNHGALNVNNPRKLNLTSGFRRLQMYTNVELRVVPRKAWLEMGAMVRRLTIAYVMSQAKCATEAADSSSMRA
jgi:hypothetical protein